MDSTLKHLDNGNIELTITVSWPAVQKAYEEVVDAAVKRTEIKGWRKGHAPRSAVEAKLDRNQTFSHALQHLLPQAYQAAVDKHGLKPVVYPSIRITQGKEGDTWVFVATLCEAPQVVLGPIAKLEELIKTSQVKIADILVEQESNQRLGALAENLTRLGLTVDKYLATKKLTSADLQARLASEAKHDLVVEFILRQVQAEHKLASRQTTLDFLTTKV